MALVLVGAAVLAAVYFFGGVREIEEDFSQAETPRQLEGQVPQPATGQGQETGPTVAPIAVGTEKVALATFQGVIGGELNYAIGIQAQKLPLTDEVSIMCTTQNLGGVVELDLNSVKEVIISSPGELSSQIAVGEQMVIFSEDVDGVITAHTLAVDAETCE